jgi:hypothetical protein
MEETLFKLARAITDTGTDTVSSEGGTITYRITSLRRKLVNGKVVSTFTPSCTLSSASVSWAIWGGVTVGNGYLDVKFNYSKNTGSSRSTTLIFAQDGSNNKINLTVTQKSQEAGVTYNGYIKMVSNTLPLGSDKYNTAQIIVMAYLNGSDGSKKPETPHVGSAPDWFSVSVAPVDTLENHYMLSLTALSSNQTGANRSGHILLTCGNANLNIQVTQKSQEAGVTYNGYIKMVSNTLPLGSDKYNTAQIIVMAYLNGSDGSKKPETPHVGSAPDWFSVSVAPVDTLENHYMLSLTALSSNQTGANRSGHILLTCGNANLNIQVTQKSQEASTFTLSGLPTDTGYYLFGRGAIPQNTSSSGQMYLQGLSATGTTTMKIPFYANDSEPGSRIECTTGDEVAVYTKSGATWISEGSFIVPSAGGTVSI